MLLETAAIVKVLGNPRQLSSKGRSVSGLVSAARQGLPATVVINLVKRLSLDKAQMMELVGIPERTLARRLADKGVLSPLQSDRVLRLARIFVAATEVLGDEERASRWLRTPNQALQGTLPLSLLDTDLGVQSVTAVLGRIAYGVYS